METTRSRSRSPDEDSRRDHTKPETTTSIPTSTSTSTSQEQKDKTDTTSNMPVLSATATPEDEEKPTFNIWAGDLDPAVTEHDLMSAFEPCGNIHSASIVRDREKGTSRGYGFVNFTTPESRKLALDKYGDSITLYNRKIKIVMSDSKNSIYIGALPKDTREEDLRAKITEWCQAYEQVYYKPGTGYAFVEFVNHMKAEKAYQLMKNQTFMGVQIKVQPAQSREKKAKFHQQQAQQLGGPSHPHHPYRIPAQSASTTLFCKNIHESVTSDALKEYISRFGDVTKATVIMNQATGKSKGFGFVEFGNLKDAQHAQKALDGIMWHSLRLSVEYSQKDARRGAGATAAGAGGGRGGAMHPFPTHLVPAAMYGGYPIELSRLHDPRDLRFASVYDTYGQSPYSDPRDHRDRDIPRDTRDRDRDSRDRTARSGRGAAAARAEPVPSAYDYAYMDPRMAAMAAAYGAYPEAYGDYSAYADPSAYVDPAAAAYARSSRDYDRDRVRLQDDRLDERVTSRTARERQERDPAASRGGGGRTDRYGSTGANGSVPPVSADHVGLMDRYAAYAALEQSRGVAPRADADYRGAGSRSSYRY